MSEHVRDIIGKCGQVIYALKVLSTHGMSANALKEIYRSVVLAKLLYASPAWWGYTTVSDKQRIEAFIRRDVRLGLYCVDDPTPTQLAEDADETLFSSLTYNQCHVLRQFLPDVNSHHYSLRPRRHNFTLPVKGDGRNFITRQLFANIY